MGKKKTKNKNQVKISQDSGSLGSLLLLFLIQSIYLFVRISQTPTKRTKRKDQIP